jgi:4'-phosphopantetheinyl transferase EntD
MTTWTISQFLRDPEDPEWEKLVISQFPEGVHPKRKEGFLLARSSLRDCFRSVELDCPIQSLALRDFSHLEILPQFTISLSHTNQCGAAFIALRKDFRSVGIDVEHEERIVKPSVMERIKNPIDINLREIELWCLKEAAFKALMNSGKFQSPIEFSSISIEKNKWTHLETNLTGSWELSNLKPFVVARSLLEN